MEELSRELTRNSDKCGYGSILRIGTPEWHDTLFAINKYDEHKAYRQIEAFCTYYDIALTDVSYFDGNDRALGLVTHAELPMNGV